MLQHPCRCAMQCGLLHLLLIDDDQTPGVWFHWAVAVRPTLSLAPQVRAAKSAIILLHKSGFGKPFPSHLSATAATADSCSPPAVRSWRPSQAPLP